jgi:hypothetical protein
MLFRPDRRQQRPAGTHSPGLDLHVCSRSLGCIFRAQGFKWMDGAEQSASRQSSPGCSCSPSRKGHRTSRVTPLKGSLPDEALDPGQNPRPGSSDHGDPLAIGRTALTGGPQPCTDCSHLDTAAQRCLAGSHQARHVLRTLKIRSGQKPPLIEKRIAPVFCILI